MRAALSSVAAADNGCRLDGHRAALPPADLALRCLLGSLLDNMHPPAPNPNQSPKSSPTPPSSPPPSPKLKGANGVPITPETPMVNIGASVPPARTSSLPHMMPLAGLSERERRRQRHSHHQDTRRNSRNKLGGNGGGSGGGRGGGRGSVDRNHGALSPATDDDSDEAPITSEDLACGSASAILTAAARSFGKWCAARLPQAQVCWESTPGIHTTRLEPHRCLAYIFTPPARAPRPPLTSPSSSHHPLPSSYVLQNQYFASESSPSSLMATADSIWPAVSSSAAAESARVAEAQRRLALKAALAIETVVSLHAAGVVTVDEAARLEAAAAVRAGVLCFAFRCDYGLLDVLLATDPKASTMQAAVMALASATMTSAAAGGGGGGNGGSGGVARRHSITSPGSPQQDGLSPRKTSPVSWDTTVCDPRPLTISTRWTPLDAPVAQRLKLPSCTAVLRALPSPPYCARPTNPRIHSPVYQRMPILRRAP